MFLRALRFSIINSFHKSSFQHRENSDFKKCFIRLVSTETTKETPTVCGDQNEVLDKKRKILNLEIDVFRQEGRKVPDPAFLKEHHWKHLLTLDSRSGRRKYYSYLWQIEKKKENKEVKKQERKEESLERKEAERKSNEENQHIIYSLLHTSFLLRVYDTTINHWHNNKLIRAMQFGQKLIMDCSYDKYMTERESINAAKQLMLCFAENRLHDDPFDFHFCNANMSGHTMDYLQRHIPTMMEPHFPLNVHQKCFTEMFPKERLVYLTPHCRQELHKFSHDDVYIVGCMVDKINNEPISLGKAKRLGLRMAKLPLDRYLQWGAGSGKSLTLNQMTSILLDVKTTGNWEFALRHVPRRKLINYRDREDDHEALRERSEKFRFNLDDWARSGKRINRKQ